MMKSGILDRFDTVLVLAPHTDDGELGCGGTIFRLTKLGKRVIYVAFSTCEESVPNQFPSDILHDEVRKATAELGIAENDLLILKFRVRNFPAQRQELLEEMVKLRDEYRPDLVLCPSSFDIHQDHSTVNTEAKRAFKNTTLLGYEFIWNNFDFKADCFIELEEEDLAKKVSAMEKYRSQASRPFTREKVIRATACFRGVQVATDHAEAFEVIRWIIRT